MALQNDETKALNAPLARVRRYLRGLLRKELRRNLAECIAASGRGNLLQLALGAWVCSIRNQPAGGVTALSRLRQRHGRIGAERELLLFAGETIGKAPELAARWGYEQLQPIEIGEFVVTIIGLRLTDTNVIEPVLAPSIFFWSRCQHRYQ